jgi:hypothetical protein
MAQYLYSQDDTVALAKPYLPKLELAPPPTLADIAQFVPAERDWINHGVFDQHGCRLPPQFDHHVDDNLYADVAEHLLKVVSSSVLALYYILGFPSPDVPNPLSIDKLNTRYNHLRQELGTMVNTRRMEVATLDEKHDQIVALLELWIEMKTFNLREISSLHGSLESLTRYIKWARPLFYALQNAIRSELKQRYNKLRGWYERSNRAASFREALPWALLQRLDSLIASDKAQMLWSSSTVLSVTTDIRNSLHTILTSLKDPLQRWAQPIGFIILRKPHFISVGDASGDAGGAYSEFLRFWFDIRWSDRVRKSMTLLSSDPDYVHINSLEFIVVIVQLAAVIVRLETLSRAQAAALFPSGIPAQPILLSFTDNTAAIKWSNKVTSKSLQGQQLIGIVAELLRTRNIGLNSTHIPGVENTLADYISRPTNLNLSHSERSERPEQIL